METFYAIRQLVDCAADQSKPIVFWVGAGASMWCGYPSWGQLAEIVRAQFARSEADFDRRTASQLIEKKDYPGLFELCRKCNAGRFYRMLASTLVPKSVTPVYDRFLQALSKVTPLFIVTTNFDEMLEANLPGSVIVQRTDMERCIDLLQRRQSFICKLHGTVSSIQSTVCTTTDYECLVGNAAYIDLLSQIFSQSTVVYVGYGLADEYVLKVLGHVADLKKIFGDGPHFTVLTERRDDLLPSIKQIRYIPAPHRDHRDAIQILDEVGYVYDKGDTIVFFNKHETTPLRSAHLLSDIMPPGTWTTSHQVRTRTDDGLESEVFLGNGLSSEEMPITQSVAMHDLVVGLLCFDYVYAPFDTLVRLHRLLQGEYLETLVREGCLRLVYWPSTNIILFKHLNLTCGSLESMFLTEDSEPNFDHRVRVRELIRKNLFPVPGRETAAEETFNAIESSTETIADDKEPNLPLLVRGLLMRPSIRKLIGMSGGTTPSQIPRWMVYPVLRLANLIKLGVACQVLGISSTKLDFGCARLVAFAFPASAACEYADAAASYVLSGRFDSDIGAAVLYDPSIIHSVIKFRNSQAGQTLRKEILEQIAVSAGSDLATSVNASLRGGIPYAILQQARDQMVGLLLHAGGQQMAPALWNPVDMEEKALRLWRKRSQQTLLEYCEKNKITNYDGCPCGSGEKLRHCCGEALRLTLS